MNFMFMLYWHDDFLVEYFGEGGDSGCMGTIVPPPGQQVFLHGEEEV